MKKVISLLIGLILITGCSTENKVEEKPKIDGRPNQHLYYVKTDYTVMNSEVIDLDVSTGAETVLLSTTETPLMIRYDNDKIYAIFTNRVGYIENKKVKYITTEDEFVGCFDVKGNYIYYGKDNNNASDEIYASFSMKNINGSEEKSLNSTGISQLLIDDYIYYKSNNGAEATKLYRYDLDGSNKKVILEKHIGQLVHYDDYLYFVDYYDNTSIYKMKTDGTELTKLVDGPFTFGISKANQIDGYTNLGVIDNYLYYINSKDSNKLYKTDGTTNVKVADDSFSSINIVNGYIYCTYTDYTKYGIYLLNSDGTEIAKLTDSLYLEYIVK